MLPALDTAFASPRNRGALDSGWIAGLVGVLMAYTLLVGWGLIGGFIPLERAYLLLAMPCLAPVAWYSYGFLKATGRDQDYGLLLSAVGWALLALMFLIKHNELVNANRAAAPGYNLVTVNNSPTAIGCAGLGLICLLVGGMLSWQAGRPSSLR